MDVETIRRLGKLPDVPSDSEDVVIVESENQSTGVTSDSNSSSTGISKCRPLLVCFKTPEPRNMFLAAAKKLPHTPFNHLSIRPDLTPTQIKEDNELREEVKRLNEEEPSDSRGPFLWKVVGTAGLSNRRKVKMYQLNPNNNL